MKKEFNATPSRKKRKNSSSTPKGKRKGNMSKNNAEDPAATLLQLKSLRETYSTSSEPIPSIIKKFDKAIQGGGSEAVEKIILVGIAFCSNDMYAISNTFSSYSALKFVCLWNLKTDNRILGALAALMTANEGIQTLSIIDCGLTASEVFTTICQESKSLKNLVLDHNPLGSQGVNHILTGMRRNKSDGGIQKLSLKYCSIDHTVRLNPH
jgi:hypothetical protein